MVGEHCSKGVGVRQELFSGEPKGCQGIRESFFCGGEYCEWTFALQRFNQSSGLDRRHKGGELACRNSDVDDVTDYLFASCLLFFRWHRVLCIAAAAREQQNSHNQACERSFKGFHDSSIVFSTKYYGGAEVIPH